MKELENDRNAYGVKMTTQGYEFLKDQREARVMFCEDFVDRKWSKRMERRRKDV